MGNVMLLVAPVISNPLTIYGVVGGLLLWATLSMISFWRQTGVLSKILDRARRRIEDAPDALAFARDYEAIVVDLKDDAILGPRWHEYDDTLVLPQGPGRPIRSTSRPSQWFDTSLLRSLNVDLRYHAALPNLLVGAGLLFTFLGLSAALSIAGGVVSGASSERNEALRMLLEAASFKFVTSLAGLFLSLVYALLRKRRLRVVDRALDAFHAALERRVPLIAPADLQQKTNDLLERQLSVNEGFATELSLALQNAFDQAFDKRLGEHVAPLTQAMQQLAAGMTNRNEEAMEAMLNGFLQRLQGGAGDRMEEVAGSLSLLGTRLEGLQTGLGDAAVRMSESADAMSTRMGQGAEAALSRITDQVGGLVETLRAMADQTRDVGAEAGRELAQHLESAATSFKGAAQGVATTLSGAAEALERRLGDQAAESTARLAAQVESMTGELRVFAETSRAASTETLTRLAERIGSAAAAFEDTASQMAIVLGRAAEDTGGAFGRGADDAVGRIVAATEGMRTELVALVGDLRVTATVAGDALRDGGSKGAAALQSHLEGAGATLTSSLAQAADRITGAGTLAGEALQRGGEAAGARIGQAGDVYGGRAEALGSQVAALTVATGAIAGRIEDLDRAANDAATPLRQTAADLKSAGEASRATVASLAQAATDVRSAMEGVRGVAQTFQATHDDTSRLSRELNVAAGRFAGIDEDLAKTLTTMQVGLQGFTRQVEVFVGKVDSDFARAATHLGSLVQQLEDAISDQGWSPRPPSGAPRPAAPVARAR